MFTINKEQIEESINKQPNEDVVQIYDLESAPENLKKQAQTYFNTKQLKENSSINTIVHIKNDAVINFKNNLHEYFPKILFYVEKNTKATILEEKALFTAGYGGCSIFVIAEEGSTLDYAITSQNMPSYQSFYSGYLKNSAVINWNIFGETTNLHQINIENNYLEEGSKGDTVAILKTTKESNLFIDITNNHIAPHTSADIKCNTIGLDKSKAVINGLIKIGIDAKFTSSYLKENTLLLSENAKISAIPNLEILNNEVQASHSATVGKLDEKSLHYLQSRGLTKQEAEKLMMSGFLKALLSHINNKNIREHFRHILKRSI